MSITWIFVRLLLNRININNNMAQKCINLTQPNQLRSHETVADL